MENIKSQLKTISDLDKSTWSVVRFGDVAIQQKGSVDRGGTNLTRYIAGDHMRTNDLHIRQWGEFDGSYVGPAFHRKFEKGDILYGSRRTYLRKVAVADFDGITANTTYVMKANKELIEPALLPFILLSESFAQHSIQNSKGSTNPYINWKDIDWYEFKLPPREMQKKLAELLWSIDEVEEKYLRLKNIIETQAQALFYEKVSKIVNLKPQWPVKAIGSVIDQLQYGVSSPLNDKGDTPILRMNNLNNGKIDVSALKYLDKDSNGLEDFVLQKGDLLFNRTNSFDLVGKVSLFNEDGEYSFASYLIRLKMNRKIMDPRFLNFYLNTKVGIDGIRKYRTPGVSQSNINATNLKKIFVPVPAIEFQKALMDELDLLQKTQDRIRSQLAILNYLKMLSINSIF